MAKAGDAANRLFAQVANRTSAAAGHPVTFIACLLVVLGWALSGPIFHFSDTWQLVINTGTTIITFLMVFLIQNSQNRDSRAIQTKLDELILTSAAEDDFVGIENLTDRELAELQTRCVNAARAHNDLAAKAEKEMDSRRGGKTKTSSDTSAKPARKPPLRRPAA